jgi:predicted PurR-regulated permease PerM
MSSPPVDSTGTFARDPVPRSLKVAAGVSWRVIVLVVLLVLVGLAVARLQVVLLPAFLALLAAAYLTPSNRWLRERGFPPALAALATMLSVVVVIGGIVAAAGPQVVSEVRDADISVSTVRSDAQRWLVDGPLDLPEKRVVEVFDRVERDVEKHQESIVTGAFSGAIAAFGIAAGAFLTLVLLFFFLKDGSRLWESVVRLFPVRVRDDVAMMGERGWITLAGWLRGTAIVSLVDAVCIGLAIFFLGVPLVIPLALLTFVAGFLPILGALVAGFVAVAITLVTEGFLDAAILLGVILAVQQLEGNVLQPTIVGRAVKLHPIVVLVAVAVGGALWGVVGAFVAVPVTAATWAAIGCLRREEPSTRRADDAGGRARRRMAARAR